MKIVLLVVVIILMLGIAKVYGIISAPDTQCTPKQGKYPAIAQNLLTADDYFTNGNTLYDRGQCMEAVASYSQAIAINPEDARIYNNRAYTYMRMHDYKDALSDLDKAIALDPNYVTALMNRGDIYNYYYAVDRQKAINDYNRVIALGIEKDPSKSVCGHKAMAETNSIIPLAILKALTRTGCN